MFKITEIKSWAKRWGYSIIKEKDDSINGASYYWCKNNDPNVTGVALSVSKVAIAIFNDLTENKWIEHQKKIYRSINLNLLQKEYIMTNRVCEVMQRIECKNLVFRLWITADQNFYIDTDAFHDFKKRFLDSFFSIESTKDNMTLALSDIETFPNIAAVEVLDKKGNGLLLYPDWN